MNLRDKIATRIYNSMPDDAYESLSSEYGFDATLDMMDYSSKREADVIITLLRDALLSDKAITAAAQAARKRNTGTIDGWAHEEDAMYHGITAAFDTITQE